MLTHLASLQKNGVEQTLEELSCLLSWLQYCQHLVLHQDRALIRLRIYRQLYCMRAVWTSIGSYYNSSKLNSAILDDKQISQRFKSDSSSRLLIWQCSLLVRSAYVVSHIGVHLQEDKSIQFFCWEASLLPEGHL